MAARMIGNALASLFLSAVLLIPISFAGSTDKSAEENNFNVFESSDVNAQETRDESNDQKSDSQGERGRFVSPPVMPVPENVGVGESKETTTLELRMIDGTCLEMSPLVELAGKCQLVVRSH